MKIEVSIWEMKAGRPTILRYENVFFKADGSISNVGRTTVFEKWVNGKSVGFEFTLEDFFKDHPNQRSPSKVGATNHVVEKKVISGELLQWHNGGYKIAKKIN